MKEEENKKVIVAISGGVDSAVAAVLLKERGFRVEAVFFNLSDNSSFKRAESVAKVLGLPFSALDLREEFKKKIIDYFLKEHKKGRTPNPCVVCNREIKFKVLFGELKKSKADYIATGHYVIKKGNRLFKAKDEKKDQSYFLWKLNQKILEKCLFPNGSAKKEEVRKKARKLGLPVSDVSDSQEICFIENTTEDFLEKHLKRNPGKIKNKESKVLGEHQGLWFYTIGQRKEGPSML